MKIKLTISLLLMMVAATVNVTAQHREHSASASVTASDLGEINFPTSGPADAQKHFIRGVLLLHSFEFGSARAAFAEASRIAPDFAMAYWGEAMTHDHRIWGEQNQPDALAVLSRLGATAAERRAKAPTLREKMYLDAVEALYGDGNETQIAEAYSTAMELLTKQFPDDVEARAFYSLSLLGLTGTERNTVNYMRAAAVAEEIYQKNPKHPGALHYLIHAYDDPVHAPLGLRAARAYGSVAKGASHAQHMPSHIFFALGMWEDAIESNTASMKTARDAGGGGYHPLHWLQHGYHQLGRDAEAAKLIELIEEDLKTSNSRSGRIHLSRARATYLVEAGGDLPGSVFEPVDPTGFASQSEFSGHDLAVGLVQVRRNDLAAARITLARLRGRADADSKILAERVADRYDSISKTQVEISRVMEMMLDAAIDSAEGNKDEAVRKAVAAGEAEDKLIFEYGPPMSVKPPWELAGEIYLKLGRNTEAADAFRRASARYPNRRLSNAGSRTALASASK